MEETHTLRLCAFARDPVGPARGDLQAGTGTFPARAPRRFLVRFSQKQGRREPEGPAKALLRVVERNPQAVLNALHA